jgi:hypothetical protein
MKIVAGILIFSLIAFAGHSQQNEWATADKNATKQTVALYKNLHRLAGKKVLFGHQDDLAYGVGWSYEKDRSDIKDVTGAYPAVYGWELGNLEYDSTANLDRVPFSFMHDAIVKGYEQGAVITLSWHANNPLTGKSAWDPVKGSVASILPGGANHALFVQWLNRVAAFIGNLKDRSGVAIPVLFRPWHELTGTWFWWCQNVCTADEFKQLWQFTYDYLTHKKNLHNILWVYNTAEFSSATHFMERFPGNDFVDLVSFDSYQPTPQVPNGSNIFSTKMDKMLGMLSVLADSLHKPSALAEVGFEAIPQSDWWTKVLLPLITKHNISYVLVWRNAGLMKETGKMHYYAPYKGHASAPDFIHFFNAPEIIFGNKVKQEKLYQ